MQNVTTREFFKVYDACFYRTLTSLVDRHGPRLRIQLLGQRMAVVSDVAGVRDLLLKNHQRLGKGKTLAELTAMTNGLKTITELDGEEWANLRASLQPTFQKDLVRTVATKVNSAMREVTEVLRDHSGEVDLQDYMTRIAFRTIAEILISHTSRCLHDPRAEYPYLTNQSFLVDQLNLRIRRTPLWKYLPIPANFKVKRAVRFNQAYLLDIIRRRKAAGPRTETDLLDILLRMNMSEEQIAIHCYGFLGAAFESSGAVLHWALCHLALQPELQTAARAASVEYLRSPESGSDFCKWIIYEAMRLHPPFPMLIRECVEDIHEPVSISKGTVVFHMVGPSQRDPGIWGSDADQFRPERFSDLSSEQKAAFFPFGLGRRVCIGEMIARVELPLILAYLLSQFRLSVAASGVPRSHLRFALGAEKPTMMRFHYDPVIAASPTPRPTGSSTYPAPASN